MTATKLTKTQRQLLERATRNARGGVSVCRGYRTGQRNGGYGTRAATALLRLSVLGLVGPVDSDSGRHYYGNGECDRYTELWAFITEAGREALGL